MFKIILNLERSDKKGGLMTGCGSIGDSPEPDNNSGTWITAGGPWYPNSPLWWWRDFCIVYV